MSVFRSFFFCKYDDDDVCDSPRKNTICDAVVVVIVAVLCYVMKK